MKVIKRNGAEVDFSREKIYKAIKSANEEVRSFDEKDAASDATINTIATRLYERCRKRTRATSVEEIQDMIETELMKEHAYETAKRYIRYRYWRSQVRQRNTTDDQILALIENDNEEVKQENSNKNPTVVSVQRDYMAGEVSKDLTKRFLLPADVMKAHEEGLIHFHDADYFAQHMHNCFNSKTRFVTSKGVKSFGECADGEEAMVLTKDGTWKLATVHNYGKKAMQTVVLSAGRTKKAVKCTPDHRWILEDGTVTTNLTVGDKLYALRDIQEYGAINPDAFCLGFVLGDGTDIVSPTSKGVKVRLCGDKVKYYDFFVKAGYRLSKQNFDNGDMYLSHPGNVCKADFIALHGWNYMSLNDKVSLFLGYYAADGATEANKVTTTNEHIAQMIRETSALAGYHITSESKTIRDTNFKRDAVLYQFYFMKHQNSNRMWKVVSITPDNHGDVYDAWCVEEPETHTFTLDGGIVTGNCDLINLEDMLQNGTVISGTMIEKPHSFSTACNIATQIIAQVASSQYGGQSISLTHLAPFVDVSRHKIRAEVEEELSGLRGYESYSGYQEMIDAEIEEIVEKRVREEIKRGVQTIQYQVVTLMTTNGQAPFITVFMYLGEAKDEQTKKDLALIIEEVLRQRWQGVKNEAGAWVTPAFPKLIYVLEEQNIHPDSEYYYLTKLSAMCTAKRMVPDYISEKIMLQNKIDKNGNGNCYTCMGCRSFLTPYVDEDGNPKYYGRFNQGVVTINLVDIGLSAKGDMNKFWELFDERLELCHKALQYRHERLTGTKSDAAPILWQYGALTRLKKGETIDKYLHGGYSTLSLGYAGLWECVYALNGKKLTEREGEALGLTIMRKLNEYTAKWKKAENIDYSLYGTPLESTTYKFAKCLQKRFGTIKGVTDKNYITNSYHVHVTEPIDAFEKLALEAKFQALSPGGAISYVEVPNMQDNLEAVLEIIHFIYDHIMYAELNTKSDFCQECGYDGEIQIAENEDKKLIWQCPNCGNTDQSKMNVARRTCGYIGSQFWNQGRTQEIRERVMHVD